MFGLYCVWSVWIEIELKKSVFEKIWDNKRLSWTNKRLLKWSGKWKTHWTKNGLPGKCLSGTKQALVVGRLWKIKRPRSFIYHLYLLLSSPNSTNKVPSFSFSNFTHKNTSKHYSTLEKINLCDEKSMVTYEFWNFTKQGFGMSSLYITFLA